ncbi:MAG: glycerophosphodiester phosphodiesterase [Streptococcaceae bacterium]|nr:glycerophosphodiester phosphodiesterase [Streptococcaceae bacterium]
MYKFTDYFKQLFVGIGHFFRDSGKSFRTVLVFHFLITSIVIPLLLWAVQTVLKFGSIKVVSITNLGIVFKNPIVTILLAALGILALMIILVELTVLLTMSAALRKRQSLNLWQLLKASRSGLRLLSPKSILYFLFYFVIILPLAGLAGNIDIISSIKVPSFVISSLLSTMPLLFLAYLLLILFLLWFAYRFIFALPILVLTKERHIRKSLRESWKLTKSKPVAFKGQLIFATLFLTFGTELINSILISAQTYFDGLPSNISNTAAIILMLLMQIISLLNLAFSSLLLVYLTVRQLDLFGHLDDIEIPQLIRQRSGLKWFSRIISSLFVLLILGLFAVSDYQYISLDTISNPIIISHRGVSNNNGVQNTVPALEATVQTYKPAFVEIDIQETKDGQFVVMHDKNVRALTGTNAIVSNTNEADLTKLTVKEKGKSAPLSSFNDYLTTAEKYHQKLLVEIKYYHHNVIRSNIQVASDFYRLYGKRLINDGSKVHTLDIDIANQLRKLDGKLDVYYIMAYNFFGVPNTKANGFSMETTTLDSNFVDQAHDVSKKVYAWDVDDATTLQQLRLNGVDGIITDNCQLVQQTMTASKHASNADKLRTYSLDFSDSLIAQIMTALRDNSSA